MRVNKFREQYFFLSNFYECYIQYEGLTYRSAENAYQAAKIQVPSKVMTLVDRMAFRSMPPGVAKKAGRFIPIRDDWNQVKNLVMLDILRCKFIQHPELAKLLLATGDATLIEGNHWHDNYWGDCDCTKCSSIIGDNILGKLLMQVRSEIRSGSIADLV